MTIPATANEITYAADGVTVSFGIPFAFNTAADIKVFVTDTLTGAVTPLVSGFSVVGIQVVFAIAPVATIQVTILDDPALTQPTDYQSLDAFPAESHEQALDRVTRLCKRLHQQWLRTLRFPDGDVIADGTVSSTVNRRGKYLYFNVTTGALEYATSIIGQTLSQSIIGQFLNPQTPAEILAGAIPTNSWYPEGDIRRYGATTAASDNQGPIQLAVNVHNNGGPAAFVPSGGWALLSSVFIGGNASIYGTGVQSVLKPQACDALTFLTQGLVGGARFVRGLCIDGTNATNKTAIKCDLDSTLGPRITGVRLSDLTIQNFTAGAAFYIRGMWECVIRECFLLDNLIDFNVLGQSAMLRIEDNECILSVIRANSRGIVLGLIAGIRPEDVSILNNHVFGKDIAVDIQQVLHVNVLHNDLDDSQIGGIHVTQPNGGIAIKDNWIATSDSTGLTATYGISMDNVGAAANSNFAIENNYFTCLFANAGTHGIVVGNLQNDVRIRGNAFLGWSVDVSIGAADSVSVKHNYFAATNNNIVLNTSATNPDIGPNHNASGNPIVFTGATIPVGFRYYANGSFTATPQGYTVNPTNLVVNWECEGRLVHLSWADILGTSTSVTLSLAGLPAAIQPLSAHNRPVKAQDSGTNALGEAQIPASGGTITFKKDQSNTAFTGSGSKGLPDGGLTYPLS